MSDSVYFNLGSDYYAVAKVTYDFTTNKITDEIVKINKYNSVDVKTLSFQNNVKDRVAHYYRARDWIKIDKTNIKYFK